MTKPKPPPPTRSLPSGIIPHRNALLPPQPIKHQHPQERRQQRVAQRGVAAEGGDYGGRERRRGGVERGALGQREEPLDVVVAGLEEVVGEGQGGGVREVARAGGVPEVEGY